MKNSSLQMSCVRIANMHCGRNTELIIDAVKSIRNDIPIDGVRFTVKQEREIIYVYEIDFALLSGAFK